MRAAIYQEGAGGLYRADDHGTVHHCAGRVLTTRLISGIGEAQIAAVSLVNSLNLLPNLIFTALAVGGVAVVSRRLGCGDESGASLAARQLLHFAVLVCPGHCRTVFRRKQHDTAIAFSWIVRRYT